MLVCCILEGYSQTKKVLIIGIDGVRSDALIEADTPHLDNLSANGTYSYDALNDDITISGPGWSAMLTGVWSDKHGVVDNTFTGENYTDYPHFFSHVEGYDSDIYTASICNWGPINDEIVGDLADVKINVGSDVAVAEEAEILLDDDDLDVLFLHFDEADGVGHSTGFSPDNASYISVLEEIDDHVGAVIQALNDRPNIANEDWLILSSTDHGGQGFSHGGSSIEEERIFVIASGDEIPNQEIKRDSTILPPPANCLMDSVSIELDGVDDYIEIPSDPIFDFGTDQDFTIECRVKTESAGDVAIIGNKDWDSGSLDGFVFSFKFPSGPEWKVNVGDGSNRADINSGGHIADGQWYTLSVSFDRDGMMRMYQDGVFIDEADISGLDNINTGNPIRIGVDSDGDYDYNGSVAEVRIWNTVVGSTNIADWHCVSLDSSHPDYSDLLGHWRINEGGSATVITDYSSNQLDGTLVSGIWSQPTDQVVYNYSLTPRVADIAPSALSHLCIPIDPVWDLDGVPIYSSCPEFTDPCIVDTISLPFIQQSNYHAIELLTSSAHLNHDSISYKSGNEIYLDVGFDLIGGTLFEALIEPCVD